MTERDVGAGWKLIDWEGDWAPQLQNECNDWWMDIDDDGRFVVTDERRDYDKGVVYAPVAAVQELITAHATWKRIKAADAKATAPGASRPLTCEDVGCQCAQATGPGKETPK